MGFSHLGIDLGTTNTVAAVFDGEALALVRNAEGATLTPSVVRIDAKGRTTVGHRARKLAERDPENTHSAFKRLMGMDKALHFPGPALDRRPEALSAEILKSVRHDVQAQFGFLPDRAVITVPALFELPQASATSAAARLAGFAHVELLQEPVASALAAGWSTHDDAGGAWLVYDLGGGTFDVSLLETREGLLRVIGHDGDNFLGGRDIDQAIVQWALEQLASEGHQVDRADPTHAAALRLLRSAAEDAKIDLTRAERAVIMLPELFTLGGDLVDVDLTLDRPTVDGLTKKVVDRTVSVCHRLLQTHGLRPDQLQRVVLVGGPTVMPVLRERVAEALGAAFAQGMDPMSLVARGAAIYAATAGLHAAPVAVAETTAQGRRLWLEYPTMSSDPTPFVVGRVLEGEGAAPTEVRFVRQDGGFATDWVVVGADSTFLAMVELVNRRPNGFTVEGRDAKGVLVALLPPSFSIVCGLTLSDPPLSRSVGIALASNVARTYLERGAPLPAKRTYVHQTVDAVAAGTDDVVLEIPIIQGEMRQAHLCRLVGWFHITGKELRGPLPRGADVEVTIEVDRGGRLSARALIPLLSQAFEQVAHLSIPEADPEALTVQLAALNRRLEIVQQRIGTEDPVLSDRLLDVAWGLQDAGSTIVTARGGDDDAAQQARRLLIDADGALGEAEAAARWPELDRRSKHSLLTASSWVSQLGTVHEQRMLSEAASALERARQRREEDEVERQLTTIDQLATTAYYRHPDAWRWQFDHAASDVGRCTDVVKAQRLVEEGRAALAKGDTDGVRNATLGLHHLLPADERAPIPGYRSGLR